MNGGVGAASSGSGRGEESQSDHGARPVLPTGGRGPEDLGGFRTTWLERLGEEH